MADCHAAVVLLTRNAVASPWVLKETTILAWRRSLEPAFKLFVVQFPDVGDDELKQARYEPLQHRLVQGVQAGDAAHIAARVRAALEADAVKAAQTLFDRLSVSLTDLLEDLSQGVLKAVADRLQVQAPPWRPGGAAKAALVEAVACGVLRGQLGAYAHLKELVNDLKATKLPSESLRTILRFAAPHWVSAEAAGLLAGLADEAATGAPCRAAALNGVYAKPYTGQMYVQRAFPFHFDYRVWGPPPPNAGDVVAHYTKKVADYCRKHFEACEDMDDPQEVVAWLNGTAPFLFLVISPVDHKGLAALQAVFPRVRLLLWPGPTLDEDALPDGVVRLLPPVDLPAEASAYEQYQPSLNIVKA
jgi:hypothetical protein